MLASLLLSSKVYGIPPVENMMRKICILVPLLLLLPPVCGQGLVMGTKNFIYYKEMKTWHDAQACCREKHSDLVTIRDEKENQDFIFRQGWIGLYRKDSNSKWKWSRRDEIANFTIWNSNGPDNGKNCAFKYNNTDRWDRDDCNAIHTFMCYDWLFLVNERKTWEEALEHCRALEAVDPSKPATAYRNHRYDLATLLTPDDHIFAQEKAQGATTNEVWTGLRYLAGQWVWVGREGVQYNVVKSCQTQRFCGTLLKNGTTLLDIMDCKQTRNFLCYMKP